jgi:transposase
MSAKIVGLDLAKNVFQVHGVDAKGNAVLRKRLRRSEVSRFFAAFAPCIIGIEACGSGHHWARELQRFGHHVRLMPPQYVRPYVKTNKHDAADAEAICEAVQRPSMRFVPIKSADQQAALLLHRARELLVRQRTMLANAVRAHAAEFGLVVAKGIQRVPELRTLIAAAEVDMIPELAKSVLLMLANQIEAVNDQVLALERRLIAWHRASASSRRLAAIPGIGPITATAIVATVSDAAQFGSSRQFAAWIGLVPKQHSSGGRERMGGVSKRGDGYLRRLLVHGARAVIRWQRRPNPQPRPWLAALLGRGHVNVAAAALANKNARIAWALLRRGEIYLPIRQSSSSAV